MLSFINTIKSNKTNEELKVNYGIDKKIRDQLIDYGKSDPEVKKYTNDNTRFKDIESFNSWFIRVSDIYTLTDNSNNLHGVIWFRHRKIPEDSLLKDNLTFNEPFPVFSIRIYEKARGKGFALNFMKVAFDHFFTEVNQKSDKVWLGVYKSNDIAHNLYKKFGFKDIGEIPSWNEYLMVYAQIPSINEPSCYNTGTK